MPHGVLVQVQSRAPNKLFTEKLPPWQFLLHLLPFYVAKIVNYYEIRIRFSTFATLHKEFLTLFPNEFYHSYSI